MVEGKGFLPTAKRAAATLERLGRHDLPANPLNYAVWFGYVSGEDPLLVEALDGLMAEFGRVTEDDMAILHRIFIGPVADLAAQGEQARGAKAADGADGASDPSRDIAFARELVARLGSRDSVRMLIGRLVAAKRLIDQRKRSIEAELQESRLELDTLRARLEHVRHETLNDRLTTLASRAHFDEALDSAIREAHAENTQLSLLFTDIDHFKSFNDRYGHQTGDEVLRLVAQSVKQSVREQDTACRYGGEEFAIILRRTDIDAAMAIGERIRRAVMDRELVRRSTGEALCGLTISIGIARLHPGDGAQSMIERADACLYDAKSAGRNRVVGEIVAVPRGLA